MASMRGKIDMKGLENFQKSLEKLNNTQRQQWNEATIKELAARLLAKVIKRTPVGKYPASKGKNGGTLRRGWTIGNVTRTNNYYMVDVINPVEYAPYVEFGHRTRDHQGWVEGKFMLTVSEQELQSEAPRIIEQKLQKFLEEAFK